MTTAKIGIDNAELGIATVGLVMERPVAVAAWKVAKGRKPVIYGDHPRSPTRISGAEGGCEMAGERDARG